MATLHEVYSSILDNALKEEASPVSPYGIILVVQTDHGIGLDWVREAGTINIVLCPDAIAPLLRVFANKTMNHDDPNGSVTSARELVMRIMTRGMYVLYPTDLILDKMRKTLAQGRKRKLRFLIED